MKKLLFATVGLAAGLAALAWVSGLLFDSTFLVGFGKLLLLAAVLLLLLWAAARTAQIFLWRVGRRLAFSYFLIGVVPIPMLGLLLALNAYLLAGFFLGHLYRDAASSLRHDLEVAAGTALQTAAAGAPLEGPEGIAVAVYEKGWKVDGDPRLPYLWPRAMRDLPTASDPGGDRERPDIFHVLPGGTPTMLGRAVDGNRLAVAFCSEPIDLELTERAEVWVGLLRSDDPRKKDGWRLNLGGRTFSLQSLVTARPTAARQEYFASLNAEESWLTRPWLWWSEISGPLVSIQDGSVIAEYTTATLNGNLRTVAKHLFSSSAELDTAVWAGLIGVTGLLAAIYAVALMMALALIYTLSRAVNRLSRATAAVRRGDFSTRIPVRRTDQIGELQRNFNQMSANLERLVFETAQKEVIEKELAIARNLQQSLLPADLPTFESLEFATLFEPSAAIGGDYFDIFRIDESRLAVVIADVSGHGLPTGLRMAMLKAALVILVEEGKEPVEILRRLSAMIRSQTEERFFVTATIGVVDFRRGTLELTNAGHPPTYLIRDGGVEEIMLPGSPLGALGEDYGRSGLGLRADDILVWLSDGLIEVTDPGGEPFGYDRLRDSLAGYSGSAYGARKRLLAAVEAHAAGRPAHDDQTLVVMRYRGPASGED